MSERLDPNNFGLKIYNRFPEYYRTEDVNQRYALKRYLEAAADGGFKHIIEEQNGILDLVNPRTTPSEVLYFLYEQYGLKMFHGIPEEFLRSFITNLGIAWSKKGSLDVIELIVSSLSGIKTNTLIEYDDLGNPTVIVNLLMDISLYDYFPDPIQFKKILQNFIPYYCDLSMLYSYEFFEEQSLLVYGSDSYSLDIMTENTKEEQELSNSDFTADTVKHDFNESSGIKKDTIIRKYLYLGTDKYLLNRTFILSEKIMKEAPVDDYTDNITDMVNETESAVTGETLFDTLHTPYSELSGIQSETECKDTVSGTTQDEISVECLETCSSDLVKYTVSDSKEVIFNEVSDKINLTSILLDSLSLEGADNISSNIKSAFGDTTGVKCQEQGGVDNIMKEAVTNKGALNLNFVLNKEWAKVYSVTEYK